MKAGLPLTGISSRRTGWVASARPGRVCADPGCATMLSIYNRSEWCWVHNPPTFRPGSALRF